MTSLNLARLARSGELKAERFTAREIAQLVRRATEMLSDAQKPQLSLESRFSLAYGAAHSLASAALGLHGYRSEKRYLVFQCLTHTVGMGPAQCRLFTLCHERRNKVEYEGNFEFGEVLQHALIVGTKQLLEKVSRMAGPV